MKKIAATVATLVVAASLALTPTAAFAQNADPTYEAAHNVGNTMYLIYLQTMYGDERGAELFRLTAQECDGCNLPPAPEPPAEAQPPVPQAPPQVYPTDDQGREIIEVRPGGGSSAGWGSTGFSGGGSAPRYGEVGEVVQVR